MSIILGEKVNPKALIQKFNPHMRLETLLKHIRKHLPDYDFEYLDESVRIFNRKMAESAK